MHVVVQTPVGVILEQEVDEVVAPLADGWIGIRRGHEPFIARLRRGEALLRGGGQERSIATIGGVLRVEPEVITILTGAALADRDLATLEQANAEEIARIESLEQETEKHFSGVYRALARTLDSRRGLR